MDIQTKKICKIAINTRGVKKLIIRPLKDLPMEDLRMITTVESANNFILANQNVFLKARPCLFQLTSSLSLQRIFLIV